jgi:hypothetical protein
MDLVAINQLILGEFQRITGERGTFTFPLWWAQRAREAACEVAGWHSMTREEQLQQLLERLRTLPPARWPSLELVA